MSQTYTVLCTSDLWVGGWVSSLLFSVCLSVSLSSPDPPSRILRRPGSCRRLSRERGLPPPFFAAKGRASEHSTCLCPSWGRDETCHVRLWDPTRRSGSSSKSSIPCSNPPAPTGKATMLAPSVLNSCQLMVLPLS